MERKIRVLVVTYLPWSNDISVGNTLSNILKVWRTEWSLLISISERMFQIMILLDVFQYIRKAIG